MTIRELIEQLEEHAEAHGDALEVRLAQQPSWPFEYSIARVEVADTSDDDESNEDDEDDAELVAPQVVCYLTEGTQLGYLPGAAARAIGWGRRR
jgi:hypothetical protein